MIVEGYAITFNQPATFRIGGTEWREIISPTALNTADLSDVAFKYNHSDNVMITARTKNKTLSLIQDDKGLFCRAILADITAGRDLYTLIKRGDIDKMSFAFTLTDEPDADEIDRKNCTRTIKRIAKLFDVSAVDFPAYESTSISARDFFKSLEEEEKALKDDLHKRALHTKLKLLNQIYTMKG